MKRILIADGLLPIRNLVYRMVVKISPDSAISLAPNAISALALCEDLRFDLVILGNKMPEGPYGIDIIPGIRNQWSATETRIILMSGGAVSKKEAREAGADGYIKKPFENEGKDAKRVIKKMLAD